MVITGYSIVGRSETGNWKYAAIPNTIIVTTSRVVATGRLINISEKFISGGSYFPLFGESEVVSVTISTFAPE